MNPQAVDLLLDVLKQLIKVSHEHWVRRKALEDSLNLSPEVRREFDRLVIEYEMPIAAPASIEAADAVLSELRKALLQDRG